MPVRCKLGNEVEIGVDVVTMVTYIAESNKPAILASVITTIASIIACVVCIITA